MDDWRNEYAALLSTHDVDAIRANVEKAMTLKAANMPKTLYHFCRFDDYGHALGNLRSNQLWLAASDSFNDPYDCYPRLDMDTLMRSFPIAKAVAGQSAPEGVQRRELPTSLQTG